MTDAEPEGATGPSRVTVWGIDPERAAEWIRSFLVNLVFALPFALLVLVLWRLLLQRLPGFRLDVLYAVLLLLLGGYAVYARHRSDARTGLRRALLAELRSAPDEGAVPTHVYEANAGQLHRLTREEIDAVVGFYSRLDGDANDLEERRERAIDALSERLDAEADRSSAGDDG